MNNLYPTNSLSFEQQLAALAAINPQMANLVILGAQHASGQDAAPAFPQTSPIMVPQQQQLHQQPALNPQYNHALRPVLQNLTAIPQLSGPGLPQMQTQINLVPLYQNHFPQQQYVQQIAPAGIPNIEPSTANDAAFATCLRNAKVTGRPYDLAVQGMAMNSGHTAAQWQHYFLCRFEHILPLFDVRYAATRVPSRSVKRPTFSHSPPPVHLPHPSTSKTSADGYARRSHGHKRPRLYNDSDSSGSDSSLENDAPDVTKNGIPRRESSPKRNPKVLRQFIGGDWPIIDSGVPTDAVRTYFDTDELGISGQMHTDGEIKALARWIADQPDWRKFGSGARFEPFQERYPHRTRNAWAAAYRGRIGDISQRVDKICAERAKEIRAGKDTDREVRGGSSDLTQADSEDEDGNIETDE
ncbi:hypothetical protein K488DRAFT_86379 [Vararia minispora EC-137]|uniref:Uncharacterized protein n=1 Tax=Vararia minispora EC-137 TaxID=1314806 RepID=A0ACB8QJP9_9AGAM|nr:hypothetical protein K488DRAFT_86379 [Vararia minispora EC-137]